MTGLGLIATLLGFAASERSARGQSSPDAVASFSNLQDDVIDVWGCVNGTQAYSVGGGLCNIGDEPLPGGSISMLTSNVYRLSDDKKRFEQIGMSWVKRNPWGAEQGPCRACGVISNGCTPSAGLGVGCSDVYGCENGLNRYQMGPRSEINPWTGDSGTTRCTNRTNVTDCRLQVNKSDVVSDAKYFLELQVITNDDYESSAALRNNNVSYKPATFGGCAGGCTASIPACGSSQSCDNCGSGDGCVHTLTAGTGACVNHTDCDVNEDCTNDWCINGVCQHACTYYPLQGTVTCETDANCNDSDSCTTDYCVIEPPDVEGSCQHTCTSASCTTCCLGFKEPAIHAWQASDSSVVETDIPVSNDGKFILAAKAWNVSGCVWEYEYALYNMNSDRSAWKFRVPLPTDLSADDLEAIRISGVAGFHDISYHSGEPYSDTDWAVTVESGSITWATTDYTTNPDANALRWGTLYNFGF